MDDQLSSGPELYATTEDLESRPGESAALVFGEQNVAPSNAELWYYRGYDKGPTDQYIGDCEYETPTQDGPALWEFPDRTGSSSSGFIGANTNWVIANNGQTIPEPSTLVLLGISAISLLACAWRRRNLCSFPSMILAAMVILAAGSVQADVFNMGGNSATP